jgi:hypothetical protein
VSEERAIAYRQRARDMEQIAAQARTEELRRSYLILAREWHMQADRHIVNSPSLAPTGAQMGAPSRVTMGTLERLAIELELETSR